MVLLGFIEEIRDAKKMEKFHIVNFKYDNWGGGFRTAGKDSVHPHIKEVDCYPVGFG